VIRQSHLIAVVGTYLIGCAVLLMVVGCAGVRSQAPQEEEQGHTEATKEQEGAPEATSEEARCEETRTFDVLKRQNIAGIADSSVQPGDPEALYTTNDLTGCPTGGVLSGTDEPDRLAGENSEDEVRGLGAADTLLGGYGSDVIYGGPGDDELYGGGLVGLEHYRDWSKDVIHGGPGRDYLDGDGGEDVLRSGDGNDLLNATEDQGRPDRLYCGEGKDEYIADKSDHVDSSCEVDFLNAPRPHQ
jgi:RTX calcium-binding nonapeptide repeat (4 copies)